MLYLLGINLTLQMYLPENKPTNLRRELSQVISKRLCLPIYNQSGAVVEMLLQQSPHAGRNEHVNVQKDYTPNDFMAD